MKNMCSRLLVILDLSRRMLELENLLNIKEIFWGDRLKNKFTLDGDLNLNFFFTLDY